MQKSFTGNSRRPRQVNLSGKTSNPFAKFGAPGGTSSTVANAQQSRLERQQERERAQAAIRIQKSWRAFHVRRQIKQEQRQKWQVVEAQERGSSGEIQSAYSSPSVACAQMSRLLRFMDPSNTADQQMLVQSWERLSEGLARASNEYTADSWPSIYLRIQNAVLEGLRRAPEISISNGLTDLLNSTTQLIPTLTVGNARRYYGTLGGLVNTIRLPAPIFAAPLQAIGPATEAACQAFATHILTAPRLHERLLPTTPSKSALEELSDHVNCKILSNCMEHVLQRSGNFAAMLLPKSTHKNSRRSFDDLIQECSWLAAYLVFFHRQTFGRNEPQRYVSDPTFISVLCALLSVIADVNTNDTLAISNDGETGGSLSRLSSDRFIVEQLETLVHQNSISSLVSRMNASQMSTKNGDITQTSSNTASRVLATYILTLLRIFPNRSDDIRMWLYVGSSGSSDASVTGGKQSAIRFFWQASRNTTVFNKILQDSRTVIELLKSKSSANPSQFLRQRRQSDSTQSMEDEWQIILLFVEMYSFVLKVMDDEEFFAYSDDAHGLNSTYGRRNSLRRDEIMTLSLFLKHLGFSMYYHAADILGPSNEDSSTDDLSKFFKPPKEANIGNGRLDRRSATSVSSGVNLDYMKGAITGLLRAIYERDSRRPFMPKDHWLMTTRFDMTNFIDAVVEEEERRHEVEEADLQDEDEIGDDHWDVRRSPGLVGTRHAQHLQKLHRMRRQQRKESRKRYLQAVAPRLEILQNMPFVIPFTTRVQIFRRFVQLDQLKRRNGTSDPEMWRLAQMHSMTGGQSLERHHARVRRGHEFEDAFEQFYELGPSLKEPIHITFLDQFEQEEAGIDGGGVTKEFLTSVTNQAFSRDDGVRLFVENDKHLLFPNPAAMDEERAILLQGGYEENSDLFKSSMSEMLQRYEFLGRIIGKCLYEGILVDIGFAGFFLLKWALTGGIGSAPKESGYRANINDLREFDEELYQGLLKLKNYPGDVEDFSLNFTVADTLSIPPSNRGSQERVITRELRPGGNDMAVTNSNRLVYISYMTRHRLTSQPYRQTNAFLKGLGAMISPSWLSMFNQVELQTLVGGAASAINVSDLRAHTSYGGVYSIGDDGQEHPSVQLFWRVMESLPDEDRRKVLKFVTSTPRAPLLGFGSLMPRFSIRDSGGDDSRLPSTSTCVNLLKLPRYRSLETCRTKLLQAVNAGAGFDLS